MITGKAGGMLRQKASAQRWFRREQEDRISPAGKFFFIFCHDIVGGENRVRVQIIRQFRNLPVFLPHLLHGNGYRS